MLYVSDERVLNAWLNGEYDKGYHLYTNGRELRVLFNECKFAVIGKNVRIDGNNYSSLISYGLHNPNHRVITDYIHEYLTDIIDYSKNLVHFFDHYAIRLSDDMVEIDSIFYDNTYYLPDQRAIYRKINRRGLYGSHMLITYDKVIKRLPVSTFYGSSFLSCNRQYVYFKRNWEIRFDQK